jgi:toxin ParE1/3/4
VTVIYAPRALRDLEEYLQTRSPSGTRNVLAAIKQTIGNLEQFPKIGQRIDDEGRCRLPVVRYPYVVFYRLAGDDIFVLHIRHAARRPLKSEDL